MRRALLIGSQTHGLLGVHRDLDLLGEALGPFDFVQRHLTRADATRDGILAGLRRLVDETERGDVVLIYYSGHGGLAPNPRHTSAQRDGSAISAPIEPSTFQYLVPTDHSRERFAGIFSAELSAILAELTTRTTNVTCILDCCHSDGMIRGDPSYRSRALPGKPWIVGLDEHIQWLRDEGYDLGKRAEYVESNPHVVRFAACRKSQTAYEVSDDDGASGGLMTRALLEVLREAVEKGEPLPEWQAIEGAVAARVQGEIKSQHPLVTGPYGRRLWGVDDGQQTDIFATTIDDDGHTTLLGGSIHGIRVGDRFLVMPLNAGRADRELALAEAEATAVYSHITRLKIARRPSRPEIPLGARAFRHDPRLVRRAVRLVDVGELVAAGVERSPRIVAASSAEDAVIATAGVGREPETLEIRDDAERLVRVVYTVDPEAAAREVVGVLEQIARAQELLELKSGSGRAALSATPTLEWGVVVDGVMSPRPVAGAELSAGDRVYVKITNTRRGGRTLHVSLVGVGISRSILLLTRSYAGGVELRPSESYTLGVDEPTGQVFGIPIRWPEGVPREDAQPMAIVAFAGDMPCDLRALESEVLAARDLIDEKPVVHRDFDELPPAETRHLGYTVQQIHFLVRPGDG